MADLGDMLGSLISGAIRARRMADEQTAALAEYYKANPLLEGLSVPRVRIAELTIELPLLIEDSALGEKPVLEDPRIIGTATTAQLRSSLEKTGAVVDPALYDVFTTEVSDHLAAAREAGEAVMNETVARNVQKAFAEALRKTKTSLSAADAEKIARELRTKATTVGLSKQPVMPSVEANIKSADVKERATSTSVVRVRMTLREEGLEWATRSDDSGGVVRTLQPE